MKNINGSFKKNAHIIHLSLKLFMIFMLVENPIYSQSLKNIKIGEKYTGPQTIETTVGGYEGTLTIYTLKDKTVTTLDFISKKHIEDIEVQLYHIMADRFFENIQSNYIITFDRKMWKHQELLTGLWSDIAYCKKDGIFYTIYCSVCLKGCSDAGLNDKEAKIMFKLYSEALIDKARNEDDKDF